MEGPTLDDVMKEEKNEDSVEYFIFPPTAEDPEGQLYKLNAAAQKIVGEYLWHSDPFGLRLPSLPISNFDDTTTGDEKAASEDPSILYFHGITRFGDNVEDEWFVVYVLKELSKQFPDVVIRVIDNDGEFLLIEGSDHLPSWAESDSSCRQRVYIRDGKIHLIPKGDEGSSPLPSSTPSIPQAVDTVKTHPELTLANEGLQKAIKVRIGSYPVKMKTSWHHSNIMLPPKLAAILKERPNLVAPGVLAFYFRDPIELKATRLMKNFTPGGGLVKTRLRFTRCLFAMLSKQDFRPDARTGWNFPRPTSLDFKAHSLGAKLTTGFEILLSRSSSQIDGEDDHNSIDHNPGWLRYEEALKKTGYFQDFLEGSKPYQQLQAEAKDFYRNNLIGEIKPNEDCVSRDLKNLLKSVHLDIDKLAEESKVLPDDDDEAWMDIKPEDLESLLEAQFQSINLNPQEIPLKLKQFIEQMSDFSGIELSGGSKKSSGASHTKTSNGAAGDESGIGDFGEPVDFKADDFVSAMDKLLQELGATDKEWEASDDSYGSEEDDFDVNLEEIKKMHSFSKDSKIHELMQQMDDELATTEVGKTFTPEVGAASSSARASSSQNSQKPTGASKVTTANVEELDEFDQEEGLKPVNIDMNALANLLESFQSQDGPSGPSANLLRSVGFDLSRMKK